MMVVINIAKLNQVIPTLLVKMEPLQSFTLAAMVTEQVLTNAMIRT